ncbi:Major facilitator superfamily domain general substrate transporter [Penicillium sp. IBT 16267x]|nr:Major facilitator superfamily domain general substrate transporter [Penicillium sp. IBT 16267x]
MGALSCTVLSDRLGRRETICIDSILAIYGQVLRVSAYSLIQFTSAKSFWCGVCRFSVAVPVWQSDSSSATTRGQNFITAGVFICFGYALGNWVDFAFTKLPDTNTAYKGQSPSDEGIKPGIAGVIFSLEATPEPTGAINEMFSKNDEERLFYPFCLCVVSHFFQQMCGSILAANALTWNFLSDMVLNPGRRLAMNVTKADIGVDAQE